MDLYGKEANRATLFRVRVTGQGAWSLAGRGAGAAAIGGGVRGLAKCPRKLVMVAASVAEAAKFLPGMFGPVRAYLVRTIGN